MGEPVSSCWGAAQAMRTPGIDSMREALEQAWVSRERQIGGLETIHDRALRLFYGPGEVAPSDPLSAWAIDGYGSTLWVTEWEGGELSAAMSDLQQATEQVYRPRGYSGAVVLRRPRQGVPEKPQMLWGSEPPEAFTVVEGSGAQAMTFEIRLLSSRHPGLFLDHQPLRHWLAHSGLLQGKQVLNTFAYTGSLSVASWKGGASSVTTLDLSRPTIQWAERNAEWNQIPGETRRFLVGDFFDQIPRLVKKGESFDLVISDPPSFSRGLKRTFSTQKDLLDLHGLLFSVLRPGGLLVTSINSANVSWEKYEREVHQAAARVGRRLNLIQKIEQPLSFPSHPANPKSRYLKGFIFSS
ncbi:class I SAM-dependent rRNA methyltransferase [bacterium]|nr:class I SAM-dependent rRNA methyltransferase [bacterium]